MLLESNSNEDYFKAVDGWIDMTAELLQLLHKGDIRYIMRDFSEWNTHAAELVGRYQRGEDWLSIL